MKRRPKNSYCDRLQPDESFAAICGLNKRASLSKQCSLKIRQELRTKTWPSALVINQSRGQSLMRGHYVAIGTNWA